MSFILLVMFLILMTLYFLITDFIKFNKMGMKSILSLILLVDVILHSIVIQLTEQALQLLQGGIVLPAGVYHKL